MAYRQIHDKLWRDPWFMDLEPDEKLLFVYLFSNDEMNVPGIYELSTKIAGFETGIDRKRVEEILGKFETDGKIMRDGDWLWVINAQKYNNNDSPNTKKHIDKRLEDIPEGLLKENYLLMYYTEAPGKPLASPLEAPTDGLRYKDKYKDNDNDNDNDKYKYKETAQPNENNNGHNPKTKSEEQEAYANSDLHDLSVAFTTYAKMAENTPNPRSYHESLQTMKDYGVIPIDIQHGIEEMDAKGTYTIVGAQSVITAAQNCMGKRLRGPAKKKPEEMTSWDRYEAANTPEALAEAKAAMERDEQSCPEPETEADKAARADEIRMAEEESAAKIEAARLAEIEYNSPEAVAQREADAEAKAAEKERLILLRQELDAKVTADRAKDANMSVEEFIQGAAKRLEALDRR